MGDDRTAARYVADGQATARASAFRAWSSPVLLAALLTLAFTLWDLPFSSFMADDFIQLAVLERVSPATWLGPLELYTISDGKPEHVQLLKNVGALPWFFDPAFKMAFFRPLSSASLILDHAIFGLSPIGYRVHVALWFLVFVVGVGKLCRILLSDDAATASKRSPVGEIPRERAGLL